MVKEIVGQHMKRLARAVLNPFHSYYKNKPLTVQDIIRFSLTDAKSIGCNPSFVEQLISFERGRMILVRNISLLFNQYMMGRGNEIKIVLELLEAIKQSSRKEELLGFDFQNYEKPVKSIDDIVMYLSIAQNNPEILVIDD